MPYFSLRPTYPGSTAAFPPHPTHPERFGEPFLKLNVKSYGRRKAYYSEFIKDTLRITLQLADSLQPASHLRAPAIEVVGSVPVPAGSGT